MLLQLQFHGIKYCQQALTSESTLASRHRVYVRLEVLEYRSTHNQIKPNKWRLGNESIESLEELSERRCELGQRQDDGGMRS